MQYKYIEHLRNCHYNVQRVLERKFLSELDILHSELFPRRKKINHKNLPVDAVTEIQQKRYNEALNILTGIYRLTDSAFFDFCKTCIDLTPTIQLEKIYSCNSDMYRSQGLGQDSYTIKNVEYKKSILDGYGFTTRLEKIQRKEYDQCSRFSSVELYANCTKEQFDWCIFHGGITYNQFCKNNAVNNKVL